MNVFELMVWAIGAFGDFANGVVYFMFNQPFNFSFFLVAEAEPTYVSVPNLATLIINPITLGAIWAWQIIKTVVL